VEPLFLDSAFVIALVFPNDQNHRQASAIWQRVTSERRSLLTTTFVLDETVTFLNGRREHVLAVETGSLLLASPAIEMIDVLRPLDEAWTVFVRHQDKTYSLTDCISFVVMRNRAIAEALTFDNHFAQAGFQIVS
jgi:uncharacterized protein